MPCDNKPCTDNVQFTNAKDGRQFCSPECAKAFYKAPTVRVFEGRSQEVNQGDFVEVSKRHPAFAIMSAKEKQAFLSFGREKAVGLGAARQDAHRVHKAIKVALDMIGAGEEENKKRRSEEDQGSRKKQSSGEDEQYWSVLATAPDSFLQVLPPDVKVTILRYLLRNEIERPYQNRVSETFFKKPLFLDMVEHNIDIMIRSKIFIFEQESPQETFRVSDKAYKSFASTALKIVVRDKADPSGFSRNIMRLVSESWNALVRLAQDAEESGIDMDTTIQTDKYNPASIVGPEEILLIYARWMNDDGTQYNIPSMSAKILENLRDNVVSAFTHREEEIRSYPSSAYSNNPIKIIGKGYEDWVSHNIYLACWLMENWKSEALKETFNPMVDGYLFIELVRQIAQGDPMREVSLFSHPSIVEAYETFVGKLFKFQPTGKWAEKDTQVHPYNPFRVAPRFFSFNRQTDDVILKAAYAMHREEDYGETAFSQLKFSVDHIPNYSPELRLHCFHRFPGKQPKSGQEETRPNDDRWRAIALNALYAHIQETDNPEEYLCSFVEALLGMALWDFQLDGLIPKRRVSPPSDDYYRSLTMKKQEKLDRESIYRLCNYRDKNGNVPTFRMTDMKALEFFRDFLSYMKEKVFVRTSMTSEITIIDRLSNPATRPASVECYVKNIGAYFRESTNYDPFDLVVTPESYIFTLFNYVNGIVPATRASPHYLGSLRNWTGLRVRSDLGKHRLILYTAPDRKSQTVLYLFGENQKVDWERHPNMQIIYSDMNNSVKVTIKNADGTLSVYNSGFGTLTIPANTEHLLEGSNLTFLSTYFPAEDEPVLKINDIPVYKEWGQPRLPPPAYAAAYSAMEQ